MFGVLKGLVGSKTLNQQDMEPVLEKMKDHLIGMQTVLHLLTHYSPKLTYKLYVFIFAQILASVCPHLSCSLMLTKNILIHSH